MKYIKFTYVDSLTNVSCAKAPAANGPKYPEVSGLQFIWARESEYPTNIPQFFGTCPDDANIQIDGVLGEFIQADWEQMQSDEIAKRPDIEMIRKETLWQAAHDVEYAAISGSAIGLITIGVLQSKPKCLAVEAWIQSLWAEYYVRKGSGSTNYDFSAFANCPHTVPELMVELGRG